MKLRVYCDGSCYYKTRKGGAGVYITDGVREWFLSQGYSNTTISRMEGLALLAALKSISKEHIIHADIYSDSEYIIKSFTEGRITKWQMTGWVGVKNVDMWQSIVAEIEARPLLTLHFHHVRGHQKNLLDDHCFGNSMADGLADYKMQREYIEDKQTIN